MPNTPRFDRRQSSVWMAAAPISKTVEGTEISGASQLTAQESVLPVALVTILFSIWGFAGGIMEVLNRHFQQALHLSKTESTGLQITFFFAYFIGPLTYSGWIVRRFGYRWSFIAGLCIFGVGALLFWPSGYRRSFPGFCGAMFVVGSGLATLETSAIPFVATCGPPKWSELRLNLAQAFQSTCSVAAITLASYVILGPMKKEDPSQEEPLDSVQWLYLGIASFVFLLAIALYFAPIPEITDADMEQQAQQTSTTTQWTDKPLRQQYTLFWGVAAAFFYTGAQISVATFFINYAIETNPTLTDTGAAHRLAVAQTAHAAGRFLVSLLMRWVKPRWLLLCSTSIVIGLLGASTAAHGDAGMIALTLEFFFKACIFPTIFTLALRGLGRHTKRGASFLVASISSGIVFAPAAGAVADAIGSQKALVVPLAGVIVAWSFPVYLNLCKGKELDGYRSDESGPQDGREQDAKQRGESVGTTFAHEGDEVGPGNDLEGKAKDRDAVRRVDGDGEQGESWRPIQWS